jgi:hypothetical protein
MIKYETAKSFCESSNETLPSSKFVVVEERFKRRNIFWIAENEDSKKLAEKELRQDLEVAFAKNNRNGCAFLLEDNLGLSVKLFTNFIDSSESRREGSFTIPIHL